MALKTRNMLYSGLILAVIIVVVLLIYYFVIRRMQISRMKASVNTQMPPANYMREIGIRCPDYWEYLGEDPARNGYHLCKNVYNIPIQQSNLSACYDDVSNRIKSFPTFKNEQWSKGKNGLNITGEGTDKLCNWVSQCGPRQNEEAAWMGVNTDNPYVRCPGI